MSMYSVNVTSKQIVVETIVIKDISQNALVSDLISPIGHLQRLQYFVDFIKLETLFRFQ
jgi:hypothetical protein